MGGHKILDKTEETIDGRRLYNNDGRRTAHLRLRRGGYKRQIGQAAETM
jgi:hypothetical protein